MALIEGMEADGELTLRLRYRCPVCRASVWLHRVPTEGLQLYLAGVPAPVALPGLTDEQRETLVAGTHPACLAKAVAEAMAE